ncbi:MAG: alpha-galactosidase [Phycisphaerales bacterium]|nr:alpha-galactosidase [Phycisphaerales bacterium]
MGVGGFLVGVFLLRGVGWGADSFLVESDDTSVTVQAINDRPVVVSLVGRGNGFDWVGGAEKASAMGLIESAEVGGKSKPLQWKLVKDAVRKGRPGERAFVFSCDDPALELVSAWEGHAGPGPVEHRVTIYNRGKEQVLVPVQGSLAIGMHAPAGHAIEQRWVDKGAGTPTKDGAHMKAIAPGTESLLRCWPSGRDDPRDPIPWTSVQDVEGRQGWYVGVEFTARVWMKLNSGPAGAGPTGMPLELRVGMPSEEKFPFFTRVGPSESFEAPPVFIGCFQGDVDDGANRLRRWVRANLVPATRDEKYPLLVNNSWGSGMAVDERLSRKMIDESAELGLELFHIDAGWFRTVGDWRPEAKKFPNGLGPISDYAHQRGLKFGLWVGWTQGGDQVDPTGRHQIMSVHDPVMAPWFCQKYAKDWKANEFSGGTVCLGEPQAVDWCLNTLRGIVKDARIDLLEHDQTMVTDGCEKDTHLHTMSRADAGYRAAQGYYRVYDTLRAENPDLLFENCVNGGHMVDYGAVRRCHYISITDTYDPLSNRRAFYDASFALPPAMCECYIENIAVRSLAHFKYMLRSGMMGWCTIMTDTSKWTPQQHEAAKKQFALYKARLRPLIRGADLYHVSERPDGVRWDGIEYFDAASGTGALFAFRGTVDEAEHAFVLKGLAADAKYALSFEDGSGQPTVRSGKDLMTAGVKLNLPERESSEIVHIQRH